MSLHKVIYRRMESGLRAGHVRSFEDYNVDRWLEENCQGRYYHNPGWTTEKFIQFDSESDAIMFSLRWA